MSDVYNQTETEAMQEPEIARQEDEAAQAADERALERALEEKTQWRRNAVSGRLLWKARRRISLPAINWKR